MEVLDIIFIQMYGTFLKLIILKYIFGNMERHLGCNQNMLQFFEGVQKILTSAIVQTQGKLFPMGLAYTQYVFVIQVPPLTNRIQMNVICVQEERILLT